MDASEGPLGRHVAAGLKWTVGETWGQQALHLVVFVFLARLLSEADFGLVALAAVFVSFAQLVVDQGLGDALIQRREITRRQVDTAFWVALGTGAVLTGLGLLLGPAIGGLLGEPALGPVLQVLSLTFLLSAFSSIQIALLRRQLAFRSLAMRAIVATIGGGIAGISLALAGFGVWALVAQQVAAAVLSVLLLWRISPWRPGRSFSWPDFRDLFRFGINVVGSDFLSFLSRNLDNLLIGAVLGTVPLGLYAVGYRILAVSQTLLLNVARRITFPAFARLQHDPARLVRAYFRVTRTGAAVILPGYVGLALVAPELTVVLFGERWAEAGLVASTLFLIGPVLSVQAFSNSLLNAAGHPEVVLRFRLLTTVLNVIGFAIAVWFGIIAVAAAFVMRGYLLLPLNLRWMRAYAGVPMGPYLRQLVPAATVTVAMASAVLVIKVLAAGRLTDAGLLAAEIAAGAAAAAASLLLVQRPFLDELMGVARDVVSRRAADPEPPPERDEVEPSAAPGPAPRV